jgi:hypothetical protein
VIVMHTVPCEPDKACEKIIMVPCWRGIVLRCQDLNTCVEIADHAAGRPCSEPGIQQRIRFAAAVTSFSLSVLEPNA